jgi:phage shock protein A
MKPQSLQDAIKAAAAQKRSKVEQGGWKEPEVKAHKMTADEYEAMKGRRPSVPSAPSSSAPAYSAPNSANNGSSNHNNNHQSHASAEMLRKLEQERNEFAREKQEILNEMKSCRRDMNETSASFASLQRSVDRLTNKVAALEEENQSLREKVRNNQTSATANGNNNHSSSRIHSADLDLERLEGRLEKLETEHRKLKERIVSGGGDSGSDPDVDRLKLKMERLEAETRALRDKVANVDKLEDETRALREKLSALPSSTLTSPRNVTSVPVTPKSPATSKATYAPTTPVTPCKPPVSPAKASSSPTKTPKQTRSTGSLKGAGDSASSLTNGGGSSLPIYTLFSADKICKYQGTKRDRRSPSDHLPCDPAPHSPFCCSHLHQNTSSPGRRPQGVPVQPERADRHVPPQGHVVGNGPRQNLGAFPIQGVRAGELAGAGDAVAPRAVQGRRQGPARRALHVAAPGAGHVRLRAESRLRLRVRGLYRSRCDQSIVPYHDRQSKYYQ